MSFISAKANTEFKAKYSKYLWVSLGLAVAIHAVLFAVSPPITFEPYQLKEEKFELVDVPQDIEFIPPPKDVAMPQMNVEAASEDDEGEVGNLPETTFNDFSEMPPPPPTTDVGANEGVFVAFDEPPVLIEYVTPEYPILYREAGIEGTVQVRVLVGVDGNVLDAKVLSSDAATEMQQAAVEAAMKCRFKPAKQRTTPVKAHVMIPFVFRLD
jgi:protein TonB